MGPKLIGFGVALYVLTRVIIWLPLGLLGTWINGFLWPVLVLSVVAGAGLTYPVTVKPQRNPSPPARADLQVARAAHHVQTRNPAGCSRGRQPRWRRV